MVLDLLYLNMVQNSILNALKQECIPVGCVPPASVAVLGEGVVDTPQTDPPLGRHPLGKHPPAPLHADIHPMLIACWDTPP